MKSPFRGFHAILYKEFIVVLRDPLTLFFMFFPPLIEMIAFGYALDNDVKHMATVVLDEDRTIESRRLVEQLVNTQTFRVAGEAQSLSELSAYMRRGKAYVAVQIPPGFTREIHAGRSARVQVLIDGSSSTIALQALNTALGVTLRESVMTMLQQTGRRNVPVEIRPQVLYNPAMRSPNFFVPGVIGVVLQIATTFATAMSIVRERERGTLEQLLVSPLSRWGLMLGKITPYLVIGMAMASVLFAIMRFLFDVPIAGSLVALYTSTLLYVFSLLSLGPAVPATPSEHDATGRPPKILLKILCK
jgi:ABC-2 type transport system permease protein